MSELFAKGVLHGLIGPGAIILNDYVLTVSDIDGGHRLTIARGNDVQTLDVLDGAVGPAGEAGPVGPVGPVGPAGAAGTDGFSPVVSIAEIPGGHRVTITDESGSQSFDVLDGVGGAGAVESVNGQTGAVQLTASDVGALAADELSDAVDDALAQAKASGEFDGQPGHQGEPGKDGVSATHSWNGTVLTITSASGTSSADLKGEPGKDGYTPVKGVDYFDGQDGKDGDPGAQGPAGYTPVKGTDYYTEADKTEMVNLVLAALPAAEGGSF